MKKRDIEAKRKMRTIRKKRENMVMAYHFVNELMILILYKMQPQSTK